MKGKYKILKIDDLDLIKKILLIAWPAIVEMSLNTLVGIADTLWLVEV